MKHYLCVNIWTVVCCKMWAEENQDLRRNTYALMKMSLKIELLICIVIVHNQAVKPLGFIISEVRSICKMTTIIRNNHLSHSVRAVMFIKLTALDGGSWWKDWGLAARVRNIIFPANRQPVTHPIHSLAR